MASPSILSRAIGYADDTSRIRALLAARRNIVDNVVSADAPRVIVRRGSDIPLMAPYPGSDLLSHYDMMRISSNVASPKILDGTNAGSFIGERPESPMLGVVSYKPGDRDTRRHELMHAYNLAAMHGYHGMPASSRMVAAIAGPDKTSARGQFGRVLDELVAQRAGGTSWRDVGWSGYADKYRSHGQPYAAATADALSLAGVAADMAPTAAILAGGSGLAAAAYGYPSQNQNYFRDALAEAMFREGDSNGR